MGYWWMSNQLWNVDYDWWWAWANDIWDRWPGCAWWLASANGIRDGWPSCAWWPVYAWWLTSANGI
jgi:hypothetical protein